MAIDRPNFVDGEPVASTEVATASRDDDGKIVRVDWSDGPAPPALNPEHVPGSAMLTPEEGEAQLAEINVEHETPASTDVVSFDDLDAGEQTVFRNQEGLDQAHASVDMMRGRLGDNFPKMDAAFEALPENARDAARAISSYDWAPYGADVLIAAIAEVADALPLTDCAALNQFADDWIITEGE